MTEAQQVSGAAFKSVLYSIGHIGLTILALLMVGTAYSAEPWVPGETHPNYRNVIATDKENIYRPAPGYKWVDPDGPIGPVHWTPRKRHPQYPHVLAAEEEGFFRPEPGYAWATPGKLGPLHWAPGMKHPQYPHVLAAEEEGFFQPGPGYAWDTPGKLGPVHRVTKKLEQ